MQRPAPTFDDLGMTFSGRRVPWASLRAVGARTTDTGPWTEDLFFVFLTRDACVEVPSSVLSGDGLDPLFRHLPGFDALGVVRASGCTAIRMFSLWDAETPVWDRATLALRFTRLLGSLGATREVDDAFARVHAAWSEPGRRYHDGRHLVACLQLLDDVRATVDDADLAELALWYHDVVYDPRRTDCEDASAAWLLEDARRTGLHARSAESTAALVRATTLRRPAQASPAMDLVRDIDRAVLGANPVRFLDYEYGVGEEYAHLSETRFLRARGAFLGSLLETPTIFHTGPMQERFETPARRNLEALLASPRYRTYRWTRWWPFRA